MYLFLKLEILRNTVNIITHNKILIKIYFEGKPWKLIIKKEGII
jgi:hypothetical protein